MLRTSGPLLCTPRSTSNGSLPERTPLLHQQQRVGESARARCWDLGQERCTGRRFLGRAPPVAEHLAPRVALSGTLGNPPQRLNRPPEDDNGAGAPAGTDAIRGLSQPPRLLCQMAPACTE